MTSKWRYSKINAHQKHLQLDFRTQSCHSEKKKIRTAKPPTEKDQIYTIVQPFSNALILQAWQVARGQGYTTSTILTNCSCVNSSSKQLPAEKLFETKSAVRLRITTQLAMLKRQNLYLTRLSLRYCCIQKIKFLGHFTPPSDEEWPASGEIQKLL